MAIECCDTNCIFHACHEETESGAYCYRERCIKEEDERDSN